MRCMVPAGQAVPICQPFFYESIMFRKVLILTACRMSALAMVATALAANKSHESEPALDPIMGEFEGR